MKKVFKRIVAIFTLLCLLLAFTSCGEIDNDNAYVSDNANSNTSLNNSESSEKYVMNAEEEALAKVLVIASQRFKYPDSLKIKNVWTWKGEATYWYTFELESKNDYGNMVSDYYGGMSPSGDLSDSTLQKIDDNISSVGETFYFRKDSLSAKENGSAMNSNCISAMQDYYLKNI